MHELHRREPIREASKKCEKRPAGFERASTGGPAADRPASEMIKPGSSGHAGLPGMTGILRVKVREVDVGSGCRKLCLRPRRTGA
jgi:hypothetical protein